MARTGEGPIHGRSCAGRVGTKTGAPNLGHGTAPRDARIAFLCSELFNDGAQQNGESGGDERGSMRNKDEVSGKARKVTGKLKRAVGDLADDERLRDEGVADQASGKTQETIGRGRRKVGEAIEDLGEKLKK